MLTNKVNLKEEIIRIKIKCPFFLLSIGNKHLILLQLKDVTTSIAYAGFNSTSNKKSAQLLTMRFNNMRL